MQHIDALAVAGKDISPVSLKQFDHGQVSVEGCEVQSSEGIVTLATLIDPIMHSSLFLPVGQLLL